MLDFGKPKKTPKKDAGKPMIQHKPGRQIPYGSAFKPKPYGAKTTAKPYGPRRIF